jgi:hypothetical protein
MARNNNMRLIKSEIEDIFTADSRSKEIEIPVFSFSGVTYASTSPPWFPSSPIRLTRWQLAAGTVGEGQTPSYSHFQIIVGDNNLDKEGQAVANGALDGADMTTFLGEQVAVPRTYSYKSIYNLDGQKGREAVDTLAGILPYDNIVISNRQWIKVRCLVSCGHADVTVKIFGIYVNATNDSGAPVIESIY